MRYKIKDIPGEGLVLSRAIETSLLREALADSGADLGATAGAVDFQLSRSGDDVFVSGKIKATIGLPCARCLAPARVEIAQPVKMVFVREGGQPDDAEDEDVLDEEELGHHDGEYVDLSEIVREQLILSVPLSPHCTSSCKGLCATCGQNLNERDCGHKGSFPLSALGTQLQKKLKKQTS